jgi:hypothetical protein
MEVIAIELDSQSPVLSAFHDEIDFVGSDLHLRNHAITRRSQPREDFSLETTVAE